MDELNRPLGQKPDTPAKQGSAPKLSMGVLGVVLGMIAVGLYAWDRFETKEPSGTEIAQSEIQSDVSNQVPDEVIPDAETNNADETTTEEQSSENGLIEIKPDGAIAIPQKRPAKAKPQEIGLAHLPDPELVERGASGVIPKRSNDGRRPMDVYAREADTSGNFGVARIVLIVGAMGLSQTSSNQAINQLPPTVTLAFAPYGHSLIRWMQAARKKGHEFLLQVPMEPFGYPENTPGLHTLNSQASDDENLANLHWAMSRITNYVGVMNYQGAKLLSEPGELKPIFDELSSRGLLFVDDGSANGSRSKEVADNSILAHTSAHIQIDRIRTNKAISEQLEKLVKLAKRTGIAIGVANAFPDSIEMITKFAKQANEIGVEITPVSAVVSDPERDG